MGTASARASTWNPSPRPPHPHLHLLPILSFAGSSPWLFAALARADATTPLVIRAALAPEIAHWASASSTCMPDTSRTNRVSFLGEMRMPRSVASADARGAGARAGAPAVGAPGARISGLRSSTVSVVEAGGAGSSAKACGIGAGGGVVCGSPPAAPARLPRHAHAVHSTPISPCASRQPQRRLVRGSPPRPRRARAPTTRAPAAAWRARGRDGGTTRAARRGRGGEREWGRQRSPGKRHAPPPRTPFPRFFTPSP